MAVLKQLDEAVFVAGQIAQADIAAAAARGVRRLVCNRPDGEDEGQPTAAAVARWAAAAGMSFAHIPVRGGGMTPEAVRAMAAALADGDGAVLAYCRSGARSAALWALAAALEGAHPPERLLGLARNAGYDLSALAPALAHLATEGLD